MFAFVVSLRRPLDEADRATLAALARVNIPVHVLDAATLDPARLADACALPPRLVMVAVDDAALGERLAAGGYDAHVLGAGEPLANALPALEVAFCRASLELRGLVARLFRRPH
ncbi:MAG TPA: hypothetical protein VMD91_19575 [Candidatus Sulfotelmatobacter sp.]|nr:hypothetical protein [Candidatus Sulfotelmatobacter sp.]